MKTSVIPLALATLLTLPVHAERLLSVDASRAAAVPFSGHLKMGSARSPQGHTLIVNNQYLELDGKPWLPAMGEFHYSRSPAAMWDDELRKMKAAGIDIVSTYVIWNHHQTSPDQFDWQDNRDLRLFVQKAAQAQLKVFLRIGPWVHAEVRYGGLPDWVVNTMPVRSNNPAYLAASASFYRQIAKQIQGLQWKDGGPVIGVQFENELDHTADGVAHIAALKKLGLEAGFDLPLYTVFGTARYQYPPGEVVPTMGGYADRPWGTEQGEIAPKGSYAFQFNQREIGDVGQQQGLLGDTGNKPGNADREKARVPQLGAEYGAGLPQMYRRRTPVSAADVSAVHTVQLGSGSNMLGYYMFHGGRNPRPALGSISLEESTLSGGVNDTPMVNYDFQAPLGPDGQEREVLGHMRRFNLFLNAFGARLAPLTARKPRQTPASGADLLTPRFAVRAGQQQAYLFVNNHVRQGGMADSEALRFAIDLPDGRVQLPQQPMRLQAGEHFIWPIHFDLDGTQLVYATAQPVTRFDAAADGLLYVFAQTSSRPAEWAFASADSAHIEAPGATIEQADGYQIYRNLTAGTSPILTIRRPGQRVVRILLLNDQQSRALVLANFAGAPRLILSPQQVWSSASGLALRSSGTASFELAMYPAPAHTPRAEMPVHAKGRDGIFQTYAVQVPAYQASLQPQLLREAQAVPPVKIGGQANGALQPAPETWGAAASWSLPVKLPKLPQGTLDDVLLETDFCGDIGRLYAGGQLVDDWYYNGELWQLGLRYLPDALKTRPLSLAVLPLRADTPIYLPARLRPPFKQQAQIAQLRSLRMTPIYKITLLP